MINLLTIKEVKIYTHVRRKINREKQQKQQRGRGMTASLFTK